MARLKYLDDWVRALLQVPRDALEILLGEEEAVRASIEALPFFSRYREGFRRAAPELLVALHAHLRGIRCEIDVWSTLLEALEHPLPDVVAHDFIDRDLTVLDLGHSRQSDEVMWRLAPRVSEALITMAKEAYTWPTKSLRQVEQVLEQVLERHPIGTVGSDWMIGSIAQSLPSSPEKRAAFEKAIENHPQRDKYLLIEPRHTWPTPEERAARFDVPRPLDAQGISLLLGSSDRYDLMQVARDPQTPLEVLQDLIELHNAPDAASIRQAARTNLRESHGETEL